MNERRRNEKSKHRFALSLVRVGDVSDSVADLDPVFGVKGGREIMSVHYEGVKKAGSFWKWIFQKYWEVNKWGEREWGFRIFGLLIDNEPKGGAV